MLCLREATETPRSREEAKKCAIERARARQNGRPWRRRSRQVAKDVVAEPPGVAGTAAEAHGVEASRGGAAPDQVAGTYGG